MSRKRDYYESKDPEDSNQSFKERSSIIYQIPMNYKDYQEMKEGSTRTSSRPGTNYTNMMSSQSAANLKVLTDTEESMRSKPKGDNYQSITTPIFNNNPVKGGLNELNYTHHNKSSTYHRLDTSRVDDERYKKLVESTMQTVSKLKSQRERLARQLDQIDIIEKDVAQNCKKCLAEFSEKHQKALEQLQKYFHTSVTKIKDLEAQKKDYLKVWNEKYSESRNYIQELATLISTLEAKIQLEPKQIFIQTYEEKCSEVDKFLSKLSYDDIFYNKRWRDFSVPWLEFDLEKMQANISYSPEQNSGLTSLIRGSEIEPISINKGTNNILSPKMLINFGDSDSGVAKNQSEYRLREEKKITNKSKDEQLPLKYLHAVDLSANDTDINKTKNKDKSLKEVPRSRQSYDPRPRVDSQLQTERSHLGQNHKNRSKDVKENPRSARLSYEESQLLKDHEKVDLLEAYQQKAHKYKKLVKKLEKEAKEKEQVIKEMMKSYQDQEEKSTKTAREKHERRSKIDVIRRYPIYDEVLKSVGNIMKDRKGEISPKARDSSYTMDKIPPPRENDSMKSKDGRNESYDATRRRYKYMRGGEQVKEGPTTGRSTMDRPSTSRILEDNNSRNKSIELKANKLNSDFYGEEDMSYRQRDSLIKRQNPSESESKVKIRVYIPFGPSPYSNYHIMKIKKHNTVSNLLQRLLSYFEIAENKHHKYSIGIKLHEHSSEKILLGSERLSNYLENADENKASSWPKFYLRAYEDKYSEENQNPNKRRDR